MRDSVHCSSLAKQLTIKGNLLHQQSR